MYRKNRKTIFVILSIVMVYIGYDFYTNRAYISSLENAIEAAKQVEMEMDKSRITGIFTPSKIKSLESTHPIAYKLLQDLFTHEHIAFFERRETGECAFSTIWCKDIHCHFPSGNLTRHVVSNNIYLDIEEISDEILAKKGIDGWHYAVYQRIYP